MIIRQSTARTILVGPVLDSTGAAKTDEVVGNIKVTKNGTVGAADGSATLTHDHAGKYKLALTANDCDTVGVLEISLNSGTNDMPVKACNVVETAIWDALFADGATGLLPANVTHFGGNAGTFNSGIPTAALDTVRQQALADLAAMITGSGTGDAKFDAMALSLAPSGSSSGDWTDGEKAQIRYRLAIDGTATAPTEPEAEPIVVTPATGIMTTGWLVTRVNGVPTAGIKIYYQHVQEPTADRGSSYDDTIYSSTSNSEGIAELSLVKGGLYYIWRSSATRPKDCIAYRVLKADGTAPDSTLELPSHIGHGSAA